MATCKDGVNSYVCECKEGYSGEKCETGMYLLFQCKTCYEERGGISLKSCEKVNDSVKVKAGNVKAEYNGKMNRFMLSMSRLRRLSLCF